MQNLHDDNHLDRLSREAADEYQPDQDIHSWEKLHPQLEAALPQKKERRRRAFFILFLFLLIGGGISLWAIRNRNNENDKIANKITGTSGSPTNESTNQASGRYDINKQHQQPVTDANKTQSVTPPPTDAGKPQSVSPTATGVGKPQPVPPAIHEENKHQPASRQPVITSTPPPSGSNNTSGTPDVRRQTTSTRNKNSLVRNTVPSVKNRERSNKRENKNRPENTPSVAISEQKETQPASKNEAPRVAADKENDNADRKTQAQSTEITPEKEAQQKQDSATKQHPEQTQPITQPADTKTSGKKNRKQIPPLKNRWEFGMVYAPDISTVRFTHTQKPGTNIGLTIGYNISKRFAVQTGALYTWKNYKSDGKDYHPPKGYWTDYVDLKTVSASCNMWDIPLNLRYNLAPKKSSNLFVSAGLSSYLMEKEDYNYFYYYNGNPVTRNRVYESNTRHLFSVLNLSVGYERQVGKTISIQAEPFFKQPLKGVGFGSVKLNTTGIFLSVKYKPLMPGQKSR